MAPWDWFSSPATQQTQYSDASTPNEQAAKPKPTPSSSAKAKLDAYDRDEEALRELQALFDTSAPSTTSSSQPPPPPPPSAQTAADQDPADSIYASQLSCRLCFDAAFYCSSIGGQLTNVYRYGGLRSCSDLWRQWRLCMRLRTLPDAERARRVRDWNREKEARRRLARNSEEVWALRVAGRGRGAEEDVPALFPDRGERWVEEGRGMGESAAAAPADREKPRIRDGAVGRPVKFGWR